MLITNRYKDRDLTLSNEIVSYIQQKGGSAAICVSNVEDDNQKDFALSEIPADTECILVLGGDGTLIRAATKVEALQIPLIGVNLGTGRIAISTSPTRKREALRSTPALADTSVATIPDQAMFRSPDGLRW